MRNYLHFTVFFLGSLFLAAQEAPEIEWDKIYGGSDGESGYRIEKTADGGYLIGGASSSIDGDVTGNHSTDPEWLLPDIWVVKVDAEFNLEWQKSLGGSIIEDLLDMKVTPDGGYIVVGYTSSYDGDVVGNHGDPLDYYSDGWAVKLDSEGNIEWTRCLGGLIGDSIYSIAITPEGDYLLVGHTESTDGDIMTPIKGSLDLWVVKINNEGEIISSITYGGSSYEEPTSVAMFENGNYVVALQTYSNDGDIETFYGTPGIDGDAWIVEFNPAGEIVWQGTYGGSYNDKAWKVLITPDNGLLIGGYAISEDGNINIPNNSGFDLDFWVLKLDAERNIEWQKKFGGSANDNLFNMAIDEDGYVLIGTTNSTDLGAGAELHGSFDQLIVKIDFGGELQWMKTLGGSDIDSMGSMLIEEDGSYIVAGTTRSIDGDVSNSYGFGDVWIVKLEGDEIMDVDDFNLSSIQIYPNPTKDIINISNQKEITKIALVDVSGKQLMNKSVNSKNEELNISQLPAGIYILKVESGGKEKSFKVIKK